jgi:23S rRNA pseudouridine1911/1915/1917 synthase
LPGRSSAGWAGAGAGSDFDFGPIRHSIAHITATIDFRTIDETDDYIVVDKPAFLLTHPTKPDQPVTLWKQLRELLAFEIANGGQVSIVNRLDRETSGLVLVAKTSAAARRFGLLMQEQRVHKEYLAIVWDWPDWETKMVDAPLDRQGKHRQSAIWLKQTIHPNGAPAVTEFRVERRFEKQSVTDHSSPGASRLPLPSRGEDNGEGCAPNKFALIRAIPKTGRTHQIRVHLASVGHPIVGDKIYGPDEKLYLEFIETGWTPKLRRELLLTRQALHSAKLSIDGAHEWNAALPTDLIGFAGNL